MLALALTISESAKSVEDQLIVLENVLAAEYLRCKSAEIYASLGAALAEQLASPYATSGESISFPTSIKARTDE